MKDRIPYPQLKGFANLLLELLRLEMARTAELKANLKQLNRLMENLLEDNADE